MRRATVTNDSEDDRDKVGCGCIAAMNSVRFGCCGGLCVGFCLDEHVKGTQMYGRRDYVENVGYTGFCTRKKALVDGLSDPRHTG
jgi:hypothetical protein